MLCWIRVQCRVLVFNQLSLRARLLLMSFHINFMLLLFYFYITHDMDSSVLWKISASKISKSWVHLSPSKFKFIHNCSLSPSLISKSWVQVLQLKLNYIVSLYKCFWDTAGKPTAFNMIICCQYADSNVYFEFSVFLWTWLVESLWMTFTYIISQISWRVKMLIQTLKERGGLLVG